MRDSRTVVARVLLGTVAVQIALGTVWFVANLGDVPRYADSREYMSLSLHLEVDEYRGIVYPAFLALIHKGWEMPAFGTVVQILQTGLALACIVYFLRVVVPELNLPGVRNRRRTIAFLAVLTALLFLDPQVGHFTLSIFTDSPTLAMCLVFSAALADLGAGRSPIWRPGILLGVSFLLAAGLRAEKLLVLVGAFLTTGLVWWILAKHRPAETRRDLGRRFAVALVVVGVGFAVVVAVQRFVYKDYGRWAPRNEVLHHRVIYPNLASIYDDLPEEVRSRLSPEQVEAYDRHLKNTWAVVNQYTHYDAAERQRLTDQLAPLAWRAHWPGILADVVSDSIEDLAATLSFYGHLLVWRLHGGGDYAYEVVFRGAPFTYTMLSHRHPRISGVYVLWAGISFVFALGIAVCAGIERVRRGSPRLPTRAVVALAPAASLALFNAGAFSLSADLVHPRYVIFAHAIGLFAVYAVALQWAITVLGADQTPARRRS